MLEYIKKILNLVLIIVIIILIFIFTDKLLLNTGREDNLNSIQAETTGAGQAHLNTVDEKKAQRIADSMTQRLIDLI